MLWLLDLQLRTEENIQNDDVPSDRVFQITLNAMVRISLPNGEEWEILLGRSFYWLVNIWGVVILTILTFFKAKKHYSVNIEHQIKSKLAWPVCKKGMKLNKMVQDQLLQQKMKFLLGYYLEIVIHWWQWTFD